MSIQTWLDEFYSVPVKDVPKRKAAAHSLKKWIGLLPENLKKHKLIYEEQVLRDLVTGDTVIISSDNCALCYYYLDDSEITSIKRCGKCPLFKLRGESCDRELNDRKPAPYYAKSVIPMVTLLSKLI